MSRIAIVGGGPAGLMAAEVAASRGLGVDVYDAMPSVGRKFLLAGKGGLNLTHSEQLSAFLSRYGKRQPQLRPMLESFGPEALRQWARDLGVETFVGTSGRVFPLEMKAAPLLRNWLRRLREAGVKLHARHRWLGWDSGALLFETPVGPSRAVAAATVLALGGASWPRLGSNGAWVDLLSQRGVGIEPLRPANCGFEVAWSSHFRERFAGCPLKSVVASWAGGSRQGEMVITEHGVEGSLIYALAADQRDQIALSGSAVVHLDLMPGRDRERLVEALSRRRGDFSQSKHWHRAGIDGLRSGLLREVLAGSELNEPTVLASTLKAFPLRLLAPRPLEEAISTAGGVTFESMDERLMLHNLDGVFCAGEMLDWEAPTGGYLLTACMATGRWAGQGAADWAACQGSIEATA